MTFSELKEKNDSIKKEISKLEKEKDKLVSKYIRENCKFKVGDLVEFVSTEYPDDSIRGYDVYRCEPIESFSLSFKDGEITINFPYSFSYRDYANVKDIQLFDPNDYTLRSKFVEELELNDHFILVVDKPNSTKGKKYEVVLKSEYSNGNIIYQYYNDNGELTILIEGEYVNCYANTCL